MPEITNEELDAVYSALRVLAEVQHVIEHKEPYILNLAGFNQLLRRHHIMPQKIRDIYATYCAPTPEAAGHPVLPAGAGRGDSVELSTPPAGEQRYTQRKQHEREYPRTLDNLDDDDDPYGMRQHGLADGWG